MLKLNIDYCKAKPVNIPKITILLDHGYHPDDLTQALQKIYPPIMAKIRSVGFTVMKHTAPTMSFPDRPIA